MDAMLAKALLERIAKLEAEVKALKKPWTHDFSKLAGGNQYTWSSTTGLNTTWTAS